MDIFHTATVCGAVRCAGIGGSIGITHGIGITGRIGCRVSGCVGFSGGVRHNGTIWSGRVARLWLARAFVGHVVVGSVVGPGILCSVTRLLIAA